jgi:chemotaxis methyl-accepting protein methylase
LGAPGDAVRDRRLIVDTGGAPRVTPAIAGMTEWRHGDLLTRAEPGPWDLILCRNVAIYLRPEAADRIWNALVATLRPGGYLVLGRAERPAGVDGLVAVRPCVYRKAGKACNGGKGTGRS